MTYEINKIIMNTQCTSDSQRDQVIDLDDIYACLVLMLLKSSFTQVLGLGPVITNACLSIMKCGEMKE